MVIVVFAAAVFVSAARHARPQMVATEARKARRLAAALAKTGAADPTAHVKPLPPTPAAASVPSAAPTDRARRNRCLSARVEEERGYTPPPSSARWRTPRGTRRPRRARPRRRTRPPPSPTGTAPRAASPTSPSASYVASISVAPKPGRKFTVAGMKGYEKRQAKREEKRRSAEAAGKIPANDTDGNKRKSASDASAPAEAKRPKKIAFAEAGESADVPATEKDGAREMRGTRRATPQSASPSRRAIRARLPSSFATRTRPWSTFSAGPRRKPSGRGAARRETHPGSNPPTDGNSIRTCRIGCFTTSSTRRRWTTTSSR